MSCEQFKPFDKCLYLYLLLWVLEVVRYDDSSSNSTCQYAFSASNLEKRVEPCKLVVTISTVGTGQCSLLMALFRSLGSKETLKLPLGFSVTTNELTQSVGLFTLTMIPSFSILSNAWSNLGIKARATFLTPCTTGLTLLSISIWYL